MRDYDLVVVGGGPAGATLARALRAQGWHVLLIDKAEFPRDKTCAGWVTPAVFDVLRIDPAEYARERVLQPIHAFRIGLMGQPACEHHHGDAPVSYGIRRCEFDDYLRQQSGVEQALGEPVRELAREDGRWIVNGKYRAPWLIGAGGHFCPVAAHLGEGPGSHELAVTAKEVEFRMSPAQQRECAARGDTPELWFCRDLKGYAWIFRKGEYLNIGLGREDNHRLGQHLEEFVSAMQAAGRLPPALPSRYKGHAYLLYGHAQRPLASRGCLLVGDAAGLAYTQSGEGIRPAVESALLAARLLTQHRDAPQQVMKGYDAALRARFGRRGDRPRRPLPQWLKLALAPGLMRNAWFTRRVVAERWFLRHQAPALGPEA
ncbi:MAG: NAD(P)/FAD-dependent oxidoreductase [Gammaproteobacteria bacterium]